MSCCPVNSEPVLESVAPDLGAIKTSGLATFYQAGPAKARARLLAFTDIFDPDSGHSKQDADHLGKIGYAVLLVDLTDVNFENSQRASIQDAIAYLQSEYKCETFVSYGYCFGGWVGAHQSALATPVIKGNIYFHPSWSLESLVSVDGAMEKLAERITVPQLLIAASADPPFVRENGRVIEILPGKPETGKRNSALNFPDVNHGDLEKPGVKASVAKAWHTALKLIQTVAPQ